jgi:N-acyl-phosphatidylethanolamine-hydrolysing phospholipase D
MKPVHMNPEEAVQAHRERGARHSVGLHFGTWQLTDEAIDAPVRDLAAARRAAGIDEATFRAPEAGETVRVTAG